MDKNGRNSCTGKSLHIDIRYFFTKDRFQKGEIDLKYCATEKMVADFLTKPLQGKLFHKFREIIMGCKPVTELGDPNIKGEDPSPPVDTNSKDLKKTRFR